VTAKPKPQKVNEPVWAYASNPGTRQHEWSAVTIVARSPATAGQMTVEWDGEKWQSFDVGGGRRRIHTHGGGGAGAHVA
jgi:hypothetical protein